MAPDLLSARRRRVLRALALAAGLWPWAAAGQDLDVRVEVAPPSLVLADPLDEVVLDWTVDLGPTRSLVVESQQLFVDGRSFRRLQRRAGASGPVTFRDRVASDDLFAAYDGDGAFDFRRQFVVRSPRGASLFAMGRIRVPVLPPALGGVTATAEPVTLCSDEVTVTWTVRARPHRGLRVRSPAGELSGGRGVPTQLDQILEGPSSEVGERLRVPLELIVAGAAGQGIDYSRTFRFDARGIAAGERQGRVRLTIDPSPFSIGAELPASGVAVGQPAVLRVSWAANACPGQVLTSEAGRFETPDGRLLGRVSERLVLAGATAPETVRVPAQVTLEASGLDAGQIRYVREFSDQLGTAQSGQLRLDLTGGIAAPFALTRLALQFRGGEVFRLVGQGEELAAVAEITYTGTGLLQGAWEVADPATTMGLPVYREVGLVRRRLAAGGQIRLNSPVLPTELTGTHLLRLRLDEPSTDFAEPPVLAYQVAQQVEFVSRVRPRPPPDAPPVGDDDPVMERELLVLSADMAEARRLEQLGLEVKMRSVLDALGLVASVLRVPPGVAAGRLVADLRRRHPTLWVDANHLYFSQSAGRDARPYPAVVEDIGWGKEQEQCRSELRIGIADSAVGQELPSEGCGAFQLPGELTSPEHGTTVLDLLLELVPEAGGAVFVAEVLQGELTMSGVYRDFVSLFRLIRAVDGLVGGDCSAKLIQLGIAGRRSLILKWLVDWLERHHVFIVAPFGSARQNVYPAAYGWVFGAVAGDPGSLPGAAVKVPDKDGLGECGNSCAVPFVAAALWVAGAGSDGVSRADILERIVKDKKLDRTLRAPSCAAE